MIWQDLVFLCGSTLSIVTLAPTLRDTTSRIPLATTAPSAVLGVVYAVTFFTLGMSFSAVGSLVAGAMWTLIGAFRSPHRFNDAPSATAFPAHADD
nr:hypothetical protein [Halomarina sp. PSRA2]